MRKAYSWFRRATGTGRSREPQTQHRATAVCFVAPLPRLAKRTRLLKFAREYERAGFGVSLIGWERENHEASIPFDAEAASTTVIAHRGGGYASGSLGPDYLKWITKSAIILMRQRPRVVHALGLEGALASMPLRALFWRTVVIYDDADRFSLCHGLSPRALAGVQGLERLVSRLASVHLIPGAARYPDGLPCKNTVIIKNSPSETAVAEAFARPLAPSEKLTLLVTGWLGDTRGAKPIRAIAEELVSDSRFEFVVAGRLTGRDAEDFVKQPHVSYLGEISNSEAIRLAAESFLVFTLYDPRIEINRYAEPNKWGDCIATNVPFLVNEEVVTASPYIDSGAAICFPYDQPRRGAEAIRNLADDPIKYRAMKEALRELPLPSFDGSIQEELIPLIRRSTC